MTMGKLRDSEILLAVINTLNETKYSFAKKLDYKSVQSVYHVIDNDESYNLTEGMKKRIITAFPNVSYNFLCSGQGDIILDADAMRNQMNFFNIPINEEIEFREFVISVSKKQDKIIELLTKNNRLLEKAFGEK